MSRLPAPAANAVTTRMRRGAVGLLTMTVIGVLAACTPVAPAPTPSGTSITPTTGPTSSGSPSAGATDSPVPAPALVPDGTAADNLPYFAAVTGAVWATDSRVSGRAYIDALVAAGFDKTAMQVTSDTSTVGNPAESIQFSVRWGDQCLVGQVGPATGDPVTVVVPVVAEGTCLIGQTRPIDW